VDWLSLAVFAGWGAISGAAVPEGIRLLPEPAPTPRPEEDSADAPPPPAEKELYTDLARARGLRVGSAVATAVVSGAVGVGLGFSWAGVLWAVLAPIGVALAVIDWRTMLLPTWVIGHAYAVVLIVLAAATAFDHDLGPLMRAGWGWLIAGATYFVLWLIYPRGMGYGDVRLSGVLGLGLGFLGWGQLLTGIYAGFLLGGVIGAVLSTLRLFDRKSYPFGPFMLIGALIGVFFGADVAAWYWG
jgi:leader peptidase (prepilin peptidase)/N-methyltransferase